MSKPAELILNLKKSRGIINPLIYGHFSEHIGGVFYDGLWVGEDSEVENVRGFRKALVDSFKKINPPVLRWPGGCFAETYDWRDGIGPREKRPTRAGWWYSYDGRAESNAVGTHEFMDFCRMVGAEPYVAANMTSLNPQDILHWIEYCNLPAGATTLANERAQNGDEQPFDVSLWGIGNENWGGGGRMTPEMCAREYVRYATLCQNLMPKKLQLIMCGANAYDLDWTRRVMQEWAMATKGRAPLWGLSIHYYCGTAGNPEDFTEDQWYELMFKADFMRRIVDDHRAAMDPFDPDREITMVIDEWGCWHKDGTGPSKGYNLFEQQSSMRDAVVAALTLNIFNNRCDVVAMANVAQLCNNLHSLYLAGGENFVETPNYHVFDLFKTHQGGRQIEVSVNGESIEREGYRPMELISASASEKDEEITITLANLHLTEAQRVKLTFVGGVCTGSAHVSVLHHEDAHAMNTFENPTAVVPTHYEAGSLDEIEVPAAGIVSIVMKKA